MNPQADIPFWRQVIHHLVTLLAVCAMGMLLMRQIEQLRQGDWLALNAMAYYALVATLFLIRRPTVNHSTRPMHWVFAVGASTLPFLIQTTPHHIQPLVWISLPFQAVGSAVVLLALTTLGRSFGVIAAHRGKIETRGLYGFVRHPIYAGALMVGLAMVLQNPMPINILLLLTELGCQWMRIGEEEKILSQDPTYQTYQQQVRYRLLPGVF